MAQEDPQAALSWVSRISSETERTKQSEAIARDYWMRQNPSAARQ